jgi:hypothetical protein
VTVTLFLEPDDRDRLLDPAIIDLVIRAELPLPQHDPDGVLMEVMWMCMLHGPCGTDNPNVPCMVNAGRCGLKACQKRFPKDFNPETIVKEDGYPVYRHRDDRASFKKTIHGQIVIFDNRHVVPYNPFLCRKYNAHINVEICASVRMVKYIHKYIYKGTDRSTVRISGLPMGEAPTHQVAAENDKIAQHLQGHYIGPCEAMWRLFEFPVHEEFPNVVQLAVHLPGMEPIYFAADVNPDEILNHIENRLTTLMAFFHYNTEYPNDRNWLYSEFPEQHMFSKKTRRWMP